jgi:TonB family protein
VAAALAGLLLLCLVLFAVVPPRRAPALQASAEREEATVTVERADLLERPAANGRVLGGLPRDSRVRVLSDRGRWFEVESPEGKRGFVAVENLERETDRDSRKRQTETILGFEPIYGVVAEDTDVLLAPYPLAARAGRLRKGSVITIQSVDHAYFAFRQEKSSIAYVHSADVDLVPPDPRKPAIVPEKGRALRNLQVIELPLPEEMPMEPESAEAQAQTQTEPAPVEAAEEPAPDLLSEAVLVSKVNPVYPEMARRAGVSGTVVLEVTIDEAGRVTEVAVVRGLPLGVSEAAVEAVRRWQYRPARGPAGPVRSRKMVRIVFRLG